MTLYEMLGGFMRRHWRNYLAAGLTLAGIAVLTVSVPRRIGHIIDQLVGHTLGPDTLLSELGILVVMGLAIYGLRVAWRLTLFPVSYQLGVELRNRLYQRLSHQGPDFFQRQRTGDLMALATNDIDAVEMTAGEAILAGFDGTMTLVMVLATMLFGVDWRLTLLALLPFPFMALAFGWISSRVHDAWRDSLERFSQLNDHVQETLGGIRTLRSLGLVKRSAAEFADLAGHAADASLAAQRWEAAYEPAVGLTLGAAVTLSLAVGGYFVWHGQITIGTLTSFTMYLGQLIWPMFAMGWVTSLLARGKAAWERLEPILSEPDSIIDSGTLPVVATSRLDVRTVSFQYPEQSAAALSDLSFSLEAGQTLGLVGPTGAGKTTLIRLLLRQYQPGSGTLELNGNALEQYRLQALRDVISWVPQEPFLFSASISENIALSRPDASRGQIEQAARLAAIHDDILRFPQGYETPVGEKGITLSGGQRQRIAIARALLAEAPLLLLDDALSAVDTETETRILGHLRNARQGRTVIIASHRLSAVMDADHILVLRHGQVTERGSHTELLASDGWYASQWRYQQLEASLNDL